MQTLFVPKYGITYRVNPKNPCELLWSKKPFGPMTAWQHAYTFRKPIRALDTDDQTGQGVVVLNDSTTYVGSGVRVWGKKFYTAGSRIYSLYTIGEKKMKNKLRIKVHESNISKEEILHLPISEYISNHSDKFKIVKEYNWTGLMCIQIFNPYKQKWFFLCDIRQGELLSSTGRPYIEVMGVFLDTWDDTITRIKNKDILSNGSVYSYMDTRALYGTKGLDKTWLDALTPNTLETLYTRFTKFFKNVQNYYANTEKVKHTMPMKIKVHEKWDANADRHTSKEYRTKMQQIVNPLSKGIFHDTDWSAVWKIRDALKDAFPQVKFEMWANNRTGGYSGNTKTYDFSATTPEGYELFGRIKCFAAGTTDAPFDRYDMTVEIF